MSFFGVEILSSALYSFSVSFAFLLNAIMTPFLSGMADYSGRRLSLLKFFTVLGSLACMTLFFFDGPSTAWLGLGAFVIGTVGFGGGIVFYNSYLPDLVSEDKFDKVSAQGYAYGYVGSVILLLIILIMVHFSDTLGLASGMAVRLGFILVGLWWLGFAQLTFRVLPKDKALPMDISFLSKGLNEVLDVLKRLIKQSNIMLFLMSYFFFIAGVNVVIYLAGVFAEEELGFEQSQLIVLILLLQFLAMLGAFFFAYISKWIGNKWALIIQILIWVAICFTAYFVDGVRQFYILSIFVGMVFGGIQSLSRSTYTKMLDGNITALASYFSFYDVLTKLAVVGGTLVWGLVNQITGNMRYSILSLAILFLVSLVLMLMVKEPQAKS